MSHDLEIVSGKASFAFTGDRKDIWHALGQQKEVGADVLSWARDAGLNFEVEKVEAMVPTSDGSFVVVPDRFFLRRRDNQHIFPECVSGVYKQVQPYEMLDFADRYIAVDDRFHIEAAGALKQGEIIWVSAVFNGDASVAGEKHTMRFLMSTSFDCSQPTIGKPVATRVVCRNTMDAAMAETASCIKIRHSRQFNRDEVAKQLAAVASGFGRFKVMGDALAQTNMAREAVNKYFRELLDIPLDATREDVSTRKLNIFSDLSRAYSQSATEVNGQNAGTAWQALQAVTRYVDHDRTVRSVGDFAQGETEARFTAAQFGSGADLKAKAWGLLMPMIKDKVAVA